MNLNLHALALDFHRRHQYVDVATIEAAMREAAAIAVQQFTVKAANLRADINSAREKANLPH
jgi:hypothetical protein